MTTVAMKDVLPNWELQAVIGHRNLTLVPLRGAGHQRRFQDYLLAASEAIGAGQLTVTEVNESGRVSELMAVNDGDKPVLLIDGEELQGAKQNRILNTSVLLAAKSKTKIPVSCVEQGRWNHISPAFKSGSYSPSSLRQRKSRDVQHNLATAGQPQSDQMGVWDTIVNHIHASGAQSPTRAMSDAVEHVRESTQRYQEALPYPSDACGVVAAIGGQFVALDAYDSPSALEALWDRLVASYAMDAELATESKSKGFTAKAAAALLEHVADQQAQAFDAVGLGRDLRFEAKDMLGQALAVEKQMLHMSVFPPTSSSRPAPRILPPSRRR